MGDVSPAKAVAEAVKPLHARNDQAIPVPVAVAAWSSVRLAGVGVWPVVAAVNAVTT